MRPLWYLALGGVACTALVVLSRIWLPYPEADTTTGPAVQHLAATAAILVFYALVAGYLAVTSAAAHDPNRVTDSDSTGSIITTAYLVLAAVLSTGAFAGTYLGLSYRLFWTSVVLVLVLLALVWIVAARLRAPGVTSRDNDVRVRGHRKLRLSQDLARIQARFDGATTDDGGKGLGVELRRLLEEIRMFPTQASGAEADLIERDLCLWCDQLAGQTSASLSREDHIRLGSEARALSARLASWKRI